MNECCDFESDEYRDWQAQKQADDDARRQKAIEAWLSIKSGLYTDRDLEIIEQELRGIL